MTSIHEACRSGDLETVRRIVAENPALVDADDQHDWRPIFHAALCRHGSVVKFLLESGADVSAHDGYVLHYASEVPGNKEIVGMLVAQGAVDAHVRPSDDLSRQFLASLFLADLARVESLLIRHRHLGTMLDGRGDRPIHHAARCGDTEIVRLLLEHGADANGTNHQGHTVLYCAGGHGHVETVRLLLEHGSDPDVRLTKDGKTLSEWLDQFPDHDALRSVARALREFVEEDEP